MFQSSLRAVGFLMILTIVLAAGPRAWAQQNQNPPIPTMDDLQAMYTAKSYRVCLQQIYRVMNLRPDLAKGYDRGALYLLRGDCLVAQKDRESAMVAYKSAEDATAGDQKIRAHAMRVLLNACPAMAYQPKDKSQSAIDIVDEAGRKKAMKALLDDRFNDVAQEVAKAQDATSLVPLQAAVPKILDLAALEKTGTGQLQLTLTLGRAVGDRARELINGEVEAVGARDSDIHQVATTMIYNGNAQMVGADGSKWWDGVERRGLSTDDRTTLRADIAYLAKIKETVDNAAQLALTYTGTNEQWQATSDHVVQAMNLASSTLDSE